MTETNSEAPSPATQYKVVLFRLKLVILVCLLLGISPHIINEFVTQPSSFEEAKLWAMMFILPLIIAWLIFFIFYKFFWKCPNCAKYPGYGLSNVTCKHCKTRLC